MNAKVMAILFGVALSLLAAWLFYQNRDAKVLYPIYFSVFCAGAIGFIITALATLEVKPVRESFAVGSRFGLNLGTPLETKSFLSVELNAIASHYANQHKKLSNQEVAMPLIAEATRRAIVTELFKWHVTSWDLEMREYKTYVGHTIQSGGKPQPSMKLSILKFSEFIDSASQLYGVPEGYFPPDMTIKVQHDSVSKTLIMANKFTKLQITVRKGRYSSQADKPYPYYAECYVDIAADYTQWLAGHPMMEPHKKWVSNVVTRLKDLEWDKNI